MIFVDLGTIPTIKDFDETPIVAILFLSSLLLVGNIFAILEAENFDVELKASRMVNLEWSGIRKERLYM